jgi:hypothetical protein
VQGQTLSTFLTTLTSLFSTGITSIPKLGPGAPVPPEATSTTITYDLSVQKDTFQHTHTRYADFAAPCKADKDGVTTDYALTITSSAQPSTPKDDANTVKVNGMIALPKATASPVTSKQKTP